MEALKDIFDPIPLPMLVIAIVGMVVGWVLSRSMRMPAEFKLKEELRDEIRFRLMADSSKPEGEAPAEEGAPADGEGADHANPDTGEGAARDT